MESLQSVLREWNKSTNERTKLQYAYLFLGIIGIIIAGLITLLNPELGHVVVIFASFLFVTLLANAIVWALLKSFVIDHITTKRSSK